MLLYFSNVLRLISDLPIEKIKMCMGDPEADVENQVLKTEQEVQVTLLILS